MLSLTRKTEYALIALSHMARGDCQLATARCIAEQYQVPSALLMNVLKTLCRCKLIRSIRGAKGGYSLAKPAEEVSLADVIAAVEGPVRFVRCAGDPEDDGDPCLRTPICPVSRPARRVHQQLCTFLKGITLAEIVKDEDLAGRIVKIAE
jgi:Rrf2 family protein